jgi:hypothetical protein
MLAPPLGASWTTTDRFSMSRSDSARGRGELSVGCAADPRELLKLGIAVSERTVSRYLCGRPSTRWQTWPTFFANHLGDRTFLSPVMFADARHDEIVVDTFDVSSRPTPWSSDAACASIYGASVGCGRSSNTRLFMCVSVTIRAVQARASAPAAGTRRRQLRCAGLAAFGYSCVPTAPLRSTAVGDQPPARGTSL